MSSPDQPTPPAVNPESKPQDSSMMQTLKLLKDLPLLAMWNLVLGLGGLMLIAFFVSIDFMPDLDIKSLVGVLAALAVVCLFLLAFFGGGMLLPTLFIGTAPEQPQAIRLRLMEALLGIVGATTLVAVLGAFPEWKREHVIAAVAMTALTTSCLAAVWAEVKKNFPDRKRWSALASVGLRVAFWAAWALYPSILVFFMLPHDLSIQMGIPIMLAVPALLAIISFTISGQPAPVRLLALPVAAILAVVFLGIFTQRPTFVPKSAIAMLGYSATKNPTTIILTEMGCHALNATITATACEYDPVSKQGKARDACIVSRIGLQMVLHFRIHAAPPSAATTCSDGYDWKRAILRKEDVISWAYEYGKQTRTKTNEP